LKHHRLTLSELSPAIRLRADGHGVFQIGPITFHNPSSFAPSMRNTDENTNIHRHLRAMPLFMDLSDEDRERLAVGCRLRRLERDVTVFRTGELCEEFHVVILGQVKLYVTNAAGQEKIIQLVAPGQSFAEALMFLNKPYILSAQTLCDSLLLSVGKKTVFQEIERDPQFAMRMLAGVSRRLHGLVQDVESYALHTGIQRVIGYLLRTLEESMVSDAETLTITLPVSKASVASRLSLTPEYFSRVLHDLEAKGLIAIERRDILIKDARLLASYGSH